MDDGPTYENLIDELWFGKMNFCGCGNPEAVLIRMRDTMRAMKNRSDYWRSKRGVPMFYDDPETKRLCQEINSSAGSDDASRYMTFYLLDAAGIEEHGGAVPGWLTEYGETILEFMEGHEPSEWLPRL